MAKGKRPFTHAQLVADVKAMPDGPDKAEMLAKLEKMQEVGKLIGQVRKAIREREKADKGA